METGIIIQARKGSTRLPNKMILPFFDGKGVLELLLAKLKKEFPVEQIVLATTRNPNDDELILIAKKLSISYYRGSEDNVLNRFIEASEHFCFTNVIRVCADNPFLDIPHIHILIQEIEKGNIDYISYKTRNGLPTIKSHLGLFTEGVTIKALHEVKELTKLTFYQEHVTNYVYEHKNKFEISLLNLPSFMDNTESIRLTLDTKDDFELEQELYLNYVDLPTAELMINLKQDKSLLFKMKNEIMKHIK